MASPQPKPDWTALQALSQANTRAPEPQATLAIPSPARALQQLLDERTQSAPEVALWSRRRQVGFIVVSCCALWLALLTAAAQAVRAIA